MKSHIPTSVIRQSGDAVGVGRSSTTLILIDREGNDDIDTYIDRHGIAGLATALTYALARERGETTYRLIARDLDISPLAAEIILQVLRPVVHDYYEIEEAGASLESIGVDEHDMIDDA